MEKRINRKLILIAIISIISTLILSMGVFYNRFKEQISYDLELFGTVLLNTKGWEEVDETADKEEIRITLIDEDGTVLLDNRTDPTQLENHNNRPEVIEARRNGDSSIIRVSSTFSDTATYYYAMSIGDGRILRVSKKVESFISIFFDTLPLIGLMCGCIMIVAFILSRYMTNSIMKPMNEIAQNLDEIKENPAYKELAPFVETIKNQHENILKQSKARQDFTANVTHELKTPLTSISGYSELIETGMASESDIKHFAHEIHKSSARLLTTINDIIRLSELDSETIENYEKIDLYELVSDALGPLNVNASKYEVSLYLHGESQMIYASKERMLDLVVNLVDNAIRYNKKDGRVDVTVSKDNKGIYLSVKDNGIGIPEKYHERIFERFYRVDKSRSKATGGTGLGLAIVKHIVMNHQAELTIHSEEGKGTEILVHFKAS